MAHLLVVQGPKVARWAGAIPNRHDVWTAHTPDAAERGLATRPTDYILMGVAGGRKAAPAIRRLSRWAPVIAVGPRDEPTVAACMAAGAADYLPEPDVASSLAVSLARVQGRGLFDADQAASVTRGHASHLDEELVRTRMGLINHLADRLLNPTTVIRLQASILGKDVDNTTAARLAQLQVAARRLRNTVEQIEHAFDAQRGPRSSVASLQRLEALHEAAAARVGVTECRVTGDAVVEGDARHIQDIQEAILAWAAGRGPLDVDISEHAHVARYRIVLPGPIPEDPEALFEPFYGIEHPGAGDDLGLRLYAARLRARRLGGDVRVVTRPEPCLQFDVPLRADSPPGHTLVIDATARRGRWIEANPPAAPLVAASSWYAARRLLGPSVPSEIILGAPADVDADDLAALLRERYPEARLKNADDGAPWDARGREAHAAPLLAGGAGEGQVGAPDRNAASRQPSAA